MADVRRSARTLEEAAKVAALLEAQGVKCAVIGAMALAVHHYSRATEDFDLAVDTDPFTTLREASHVLERQGYDVELRTPDADDPLGGVLDVRGADFDLIQVVNFHNPMSRGCGLLAAEAIAGATPLPAPDQSLRVVDLPHLVALKLYAGGEESKRDIVQVLKRNQPVDVETLRAVCARHGLVRQLEPLLAEVGLS